MSQETIDRLKTLLFEKESRDLDQLARQLDELAARGRQERGELGRRLAEIEGRVGGDAELTVSVARIVDKAIVEAETKLEKTVDLAAAMEPMVQRTFTRELETNVTQDKLTGLLYPRIGDMVRRYVSDAMREVIDRINRSVERNWLVLKLQSITGGGSLAEQGLADSERLVVQEIYLIRRGSGELIHHWIGQSGPGEDALRPGANRDTIVSGLLSALSAFVEEAFEADKAKLRAIDLVSPDLDERRIFIAGSPAHLIALKIKGGENRAIEGLLDAEMLKVLADHQRVEERRLRAPPAERDQARAEAEAAHGSILSTAAGGVAQRFAEREKEIRQERAWRSFKRLLLAVAVPLALLIGWQTWVWYHTTALQQSVDTAVDGTPEVKGYTVKARVERGARTVWVGGLVPDERARQLVLSRIRAAAPDAVVNESMGVLPREDVGAAVRTDALRRALDRAGIKLGQLADDLARISEALPAADRATIEAARRSAQEFASSLQADGGASGGPPSDAVSALDGALRSLTAAGDRLAQLVAAETGLPPSADATPVPQPTDAAAGAERLAQAAERVGRLAAALETLRASANERRRLQAELERTRADAAAERTRLESRLADHDARIAALAPRPPTARQQLADFVRENAFFFANGTEFRDPERARVLLDQVASLVLATDVLVRIVGYTDEVGGQTRNQPLSQNRADKVADELVLRGVPRARLVAVGRATAIDLSPRAGAQSSNRRVEIEIGFAGEGG